MLLYSSLSFVLPQASSENSTRCMSACCRLARQRTGQITRMWPTALPSWQSFTSSRCTLPHTSGLHASCGCMTQQVTMLHVVHNVCPFAKIAPAW